MVSMSCLFYVPAKPLRTFTKCTTFFVCKYCMSYNTILQTQQAWIIYQVVKALFKLDSFVHLNEW